MTDIIPKFTPEHGAYLIEISQIFRSSDENWRTIPIKVFLILRSAHE